MAADRRAHPCGLRGAPLTRVAVAAGGEAVWGASRVSAQDLTMG